MYHATEFLFFITGYFFGFCRFQVVPKSQLPMKDSGGSSFIKSPDVTNCLDDDTLIAKTILGISTLQLDMMGKIKKLEVSAF